MNKTGAKFLLTAVFIARGTSFLFSKSLMSGDSALPPTSILAVRFLLAFVILAIIFIKKLIHCKKESLRGGLILGLLYTICMTFEMFGLKRIDSGVSALIENMAIVLVPLIIAVLTKTLPKLKTIICAVLAVTGVGFLSLTQISAAGGGLGIFLIICAALSYAACIITTEKVVENADPVTVGVIQLGTMGVLSLILSLCTKSFVLPQEGHQWIMILFLALICSCFGFTFQPVGQKYVSAETAAVFTVMNPLTASLLGIVAPPLLRSLASKFNGISSLFPEIIAMNESLTVFKVIGYVLILGALLLYNLKIGNEASASAYGRTEIKDS